MKVLGIDRRRNSVRVIVETSDDLWTLYIVVRPGDVVRARTVREIHFGDRGSGRSSRVPMVLAIRVTNVEFQPFTTRLRIRGVVIEGPERFGVKGKYHTMSIGVGSELEIIKENGWSKALLDRLGAQHLPVKLLLVAIDYDEYAIAILEHQGVKILASEAIRLPGKDDPHREEKLREELTIIAKSIVKAYQDYKPFAIVIGGPGFLKNTLAEKVRELLPSAKLFVDNVSMGGEKGVSELMKRGVVRRIAAHIAVIEAEKFFEEFEKNLAKNPDMVSYGLEEVLFAVENGAASTVIVLDELLHSLDDTTRRKAEILLRKAEETRARIIFVNTHSEPGIRLKMMGGVAAIHRFPLPRLEKEEKE